MLGRPTLSVQQTPEGSLLARWEPPAGTAEDQVLGYRLQFGREDAAPLATLEFPPTEDHYTAAGVHKGATYVFRLAARSRGGLGEEAAEVLSIPEDTPRGHPQILEAAGNASAGTVLLRWLPPVPAERNGAIVKYTVAVREAGALGPARETELLAAAEPGAENVLTLQGLKPDTAYDLQVRAHTRRGPGPYSPPVRYRTFLRDQGRRAETPAPEPDRALCPPPPQSPPSPPPGKWSLFCFLVMLEASLDPEALALAKVGRASWHHRPPPLSPLPSLCSRAVSPSRVLGQGQAGPGQGQAGRPWAQRTTGNAWAAPPPDPQPSLALTGLFFCSLPLDCCLAVSPKNFKVKMIMKTSVLLSWEFPDNYNSPTPYKVWACRRWAGQGEGGVWSRGLLGWCWGSAGLGASLGIEAQAGVRIHSGIRSQSWDLAGIEV